MRKLKTGVITKRDRKMSRLLAEQLEASYRQKVVCKICGHPDNDWPDRHGICSDCFCRWLNGKFAQGLKLADATGFDHDYVFQGTDTDAKKQIGNAVPPPLARALYLAALSA